MACLLEQVWTGMRVVGHEVSRDAGNDSENKWTSKKRM